MSSRAAIVSNAARAARLAWLSSDAYRTMRTSPPMCSSRNSWRLCAVARVATHVAMVAISVAACHRATPHVREGIPGTLVEFDMVRVPAGNGVREFLIGRTELLWDAYDAFVLSPASTDTMRSSDAVARPSRPYGAPDYGWGHRGFPTISVAREAAEAFCAWLSQRTGKRYRLPTEAEWARVASLARGDSPIDSIAWHAGNSGGRTHAAATRSPDALGLYDF